MQHWCVSLVKYPERKRKVTSQWKKFQLYQLQHDIHQPMEGATSSCEMRHYIWRIWSIPHTSKPVPAFWSISTIQSIQSENSDENYKLGQGVCHVTKVRGDCRVFGHLVSQSGGLGVIPTQWDDISPSLESTPNSVPKIKIWVIGGDRGTKCSCNINVCHWWSIQRDI